MIKLRLNNIFETVMFINEVKRLAIILMNFFNLFLFHKNAERI